MALRYFRCTTCGHKMRVNGTHCGNCYRPKQPWQMTSVYLTVLVLVLLGLIALAL